MGCAPFLSNTWFPFRDRVLATGIMLLGGSLGKNEKILIKPSDNLQQNTASSPWRNESG